MLTGVDISNYRGFKSFRIEGLTRVNLLVGKNNSGKTALLEAVHLISSGGNPAVLADAAVRRGEVITAKDGRDTYADLTHFFYGHELKEEVWFALRTDDGVPKLTVRIVRAKEVPPQAELFDPEQELGSMLVALFEGAPATFGQPVPIAYNGGLLLDPRLRFRNAIPPNPSMPPRVGIFIPPESLGAGRLADLWREVVLAGRQESVVKALRIIQPNLAEIIFLPGSYARSTNAAMGIVAVLNGFPRPVPLGSLGDGMRRLFALANALTNATNGFLFLDEIDTGLHYSVTADMWKLVLETAVHNDIQVFATTHSWDCVDGLHVLCKRDPSLMANVAVHKIAGIIDHSVSFQGEDFVRAVEGGVELR